MVQKFVSRNKSVEFNTNGSEWFIMRVKERDRYRSEWEWELYEG